jgi:hypothetical protein
MSVRFKICFHEFPIKFMVRKSMKNMSVYREIDQCIVCNKLSIASLFSLKTEFERKERL